MEFEWDEQKNEANIRKHGFDFADGPELFINSSHQPFLVTADVREEYPEERWQGDRDDPGTNCSGHIYGKAAWLDQIHFIAKSQPEGAEHL
jgi:hypothetical protein